MKKYKCLNNQIFTIKEYRLVPIRYEDRYLIMKWRNEQIYHLRQKHPITSVEQEFYFENILNKQFDLDKPDQILFSLLKKNMCIGYGGLVHLNWIDKNAEVSFVMDTTQEDKKFVSTWSLFLIFIKRIAFKELDLHKIYTYAFDLRPKLYEALSRNGFILEGRLMDHCIINSKFHDVLYHSCINPIKELKIREVNNSDSIILFNWRNENETRKNAFNTQKITKLSHEKWFQEKLNDKQCKMFIFENKHQHPLGQTRLEYFNDKWVINYSVDLLYRGIGLGRTIIQKTISRIDKGIFLADVKQKNHISIKIFNSLGFHKTYEDKKRITFEFIKTI